MGAHVSSGGEWVDKPSGVLQGAGALLLWWWDGAGVVHPVFILLGFPWKGDITPTSVSPRHQVWGSTFSTLWQFLQPQLPGAVSLRDRVHVAHRGGRGLLCPALLQPLRAGVPRHLRLRLPAGLQRGCPGPGQPPGHLLWPQPPATLLLCLARHGRGLPLRPARGQARLRRCLQER